MIDDLLVAIAGSANVDLGAQVPEDATHDEALGETPVQPRAV